MLNVFKNHFKHSLVPLNFLKSFVKTTSAYEKKKKKNKNVSKKKHLHTHNCY